MQNNKKIRKYILHYYRLNKRKLPWREIGNKLQNPYYTLVAEIMLQQTRVDTVKNYYLKFLSKWPSINLFSKANQSEVLTFWSGLGYYRRALNLHKTANLIVKNYKGIVPDEYLTLKKLPGIGDYTASAIIGFAYGKYSIIIDTNIKKFLSRVYGLSEEQITSKKKIYELAVNLFPKRKSGDFAQAIMDFSSDICTNTNPKCFICKINSNCNYKKGEIKKKLITKPAKKKMYSVVYFYIYKRKYFLLRKKPLNTILGGLYEVPGSNWLKIKTEEKDNILEPYSFLKYDKLYVRKLIKHEFTHITLYTNVIILEVFDKKFRKNSSLEPRWFRVEELNKYPVSSLTKKIVNYSFSKLLDLK